MVKLIRKYFLLAALLLALVASFIYSPSWLRLCYGLALFLFGMQNIEDGLREAAGGRLERWMRKSTATPAKGALFGMGAVSPFCSAPIWARPAGFGCWLWPGKA